MQISSRHSPGVSQTPLIQTDTLIAQERDTIFLHRVRLVLAELAMAPSLANECEEEEGEENPPCVEFDEGPAIIELPLGRRAVRRAVKPAPATNYNLFQVVIHRTDAETDAPLLRANPDFAPGASIQVNGTFSRGGKRSDFVFATDFSEKEELGLDPELTVATGDSLRVTLLVDVASWFESADGKTLIDPGSGGRGGRNEPLVRDNIRMSIRAFRDTNGEKDHRGR